MWNLIKRVGNAVRNGVKTLAEGAVSVVKTVVQKGRELIVRAEEKIVNFVDKQVHRIKERVARKKYRVEVLGGGHEINEEKPDHKVVNDCTNYLKSKFPSGIASTLKGQTAEQREQTIRTVFKDAKEIMGVEDVDVEVSDEIGTACGYYVRGENKVYINKAYLRLEDPQCACEQVFTVFHELNHARQCAAVAGKKDYGYSDQRLYEWALNWKYYISHIVSDKAYRMQPMEADSFRLEEKLKVAMNENIVFLGC